MRSPIRRLCGGVSFFAAALAGASLRALLPCAAAAAALAVAVAVPAHAAGLQVSPISLEVRPQEQGQQIFLSNSGKTPLRAQVRVQAWTQSGGVESLGPTREVVASPPLVTIAPGDRQVVRIVRLQPATPQEKTFRLIIDELPGSDSGPQAPTGLQFLLRYSVPVFVLPVQPAQAPDAPTATTPQGTAAAALTSAASLSASLRAEAGKPAMLRITNTANRRIKLSQLAWVDGKGQRTPLYPGLMGYVLAGQTMQWPVELGAPLLQAGGGLKARLNDDQEEQALPLSDRP